MSSAVIAASQSLPAERFLPLEIPPRIRAVKNVRRTAQLL
jgi:hypothetical protein